MGVIAKANITLTSVSDAYSVLLSPSTWVIKADFDGTNHDLGNASSSLSVLCGEEKVPFEVLTMLVESNVTPPPPLPVPDQEDGVWLFGDTEARVQRIDDYTSKVRLVQLSSRLMQGKLAMEIKAGNVILPVEVAFTVSREATMLDWLAEWDSNKTQISGTYLITPKIFVGKRIDTVTIPAPPPIQQEEGEEPDEDVDYGTIDRILYNSLCGVYIGPDGLHDEGSTGIYGYKNGKDIFHINEDGASIGGWEITQDGLFSPVNEHYATHNIQILSSGTIQSLDENDSVHWGLFSSGAAIFANGNVMFSPNGDASFKGTIESADGQIGGWTIGRSSIYNLGVEINAAGRYISVANVTQRILDLTPLNWVRYYGGVAMYYTSNADYGFIGYKGATKVFQAGSTNYIAGWTFDNTAIYSGTKKNTYGQFTNETNHITIGPAGIRGYKWRLEANGSGAIANGNISWNEEGEVTFADSVSLTWVNVSNAMGDNFQTDINGNAIYTGEIHVNQLSGDTIEGFLVCATPNSSNLRGWVLNADGSGYLAFGNIKWDSTGHIMFSGDVEMEWIESRIDTLEGQVQDLIDAGVEQGDAASVLADAKEYVDQKFIDLLAAHKYTVIGPTGIFTGTLSAECINTGVLTAITLQSAIYAGGTNNDARYWRLDKDGAGWLAKGNIRWDAAGNVTFGDSVTAQWNKGLSVAQIMAYGQQLYRDPEFYKEGFNNTVVYLQGYTIRWTVGDAADWIKNNGLWLEGDGLITAIHIDGVQVWNGQQNLSHDNTCFVNDCHEITSSSVVYVKFYADNAFITVRTSDNANTQIYDQEDEVTIPVTSCVERRWLTDADAPNGSQKVMMFENYGWYSPIDYRLGGFAFRTQSVANHKFLVKIIAKIPVGWKIENYHNAYGNQQGGGSKVEWLTPTLGTGEWEEYLYMMKCGSTGTFGTVHHFALKCDDVNYSVGKTGTTEIWLRNPTDPPNPLRPIYGTTPIRWYVAYATVYDATISDKSNTYIDSNGVYTGYIAADKISAGTISSCSIQSSLTNPAWQLNVDGSGKLAGGNITWNTSGDVTMQGSIKASGGEIGYFKINEQGFYYGDPTRWNDASYKQSFALLQPTMLRLQQHSTYSGMNISNVKVGLGHEADPDVTSSSDLSSPSAAYFFRRMCAYYQNKQYLPAVKIVSDNVTGPDVALMTKGAAVVHGGIIGKGQFLNGNSVTVINPVLGDVICVNNIWEYKRIYLPKKQLLQYLLNASASDTWCVKLTIMAHISNTANMALSFQSESGVNVLGCYNYNGGLWINGTSGYKDMGKGDVVTIALIWDGVNYYGQLISYNN